MGRGTTSVGLERELDRSRQLADDSRYEVSRSTDYLEV
jgi:hypothetical protein